MDRAIDDIRFSGVKTNRDYLKRILKHPKFIEGAVDTAFIETYKLDLKPINIKSDVKAAMIAASIFSENKNLDIKALATDSWDKTTNFRNV